MGIQDEIEDPTGCAPAFGFCFVMAVIALSAIAIAITGCGPPELKSTNNYSPVVKVFLHEPGSYSFVVKEPATGELKFYHWPLATGRTRLFEDVPEDKDAWAEAKEFRTGTGSYYMTVEIHLTSNAVSEIEGGGWLRHVHKRPDEKGKTSVIQ